MTEIVLNKDNFEQEVLNSDLPVLVDFWATWCGPCRMLAPALAQAAEEFEGRIKVGKVNVDENPELADLFHVESIPLLVLFKKGEQPKGALGFRPKNAIVEFLNENL